MMSQEKWNTKKKNFQTSKRNEEIDKWHMREKKINIEGKERKSNKWLIGVSEEENQYKQNKINTNNSTSRKFPEIMI